MKLTKRVLRENKIINSYDIARIAESKLYISYSPADYGRASHSASWDIMGINFKTDPSGAWYNYGHKSFGMYGRGDKLPKLADAMRWVKETYGITEWEKDIFGSYQIKGTLALIDTKETKGGKG